MSDAPAGAFAPPPASSIAGQTDQQEQPPQQDQGTTEQTSSFPKEEASKLVGSNTELHPLQGDPVGKAEQFEEQRKSDLDAEREEHLRRRSGGEAEK